MIDDHYSSFVFLAYLNTGNTKENIRLRVTEENIYMFANTQIS